MKDDTGIKEILSNSGLELVNPDFDKQVMNMITQEAKRRARWKTASILFAIVVMNALAMLLLHLWHVDISSMTYQLGAYSAEMVRNAESVFKWAFENIFFISPLLILMIFKMIIDRILRVSS